MLAVRKNFADFIAPLARIWAACTLTLFTGLTACQQSSSSGPPADQGSTASPSPIATNANCTGQTGGAALADAFALSAAAPNYNDDISVYLNTVCVRCHSPGATLPDLSTYAAAVASASQSLSAMQAGRMPQGGAAAADVARFQAWLSSGTPQSATAAVPSPSPGSVGTSPGPGNPNPIATNPVPDPNCPGVVTTQSPMPMPTPLPSSTPTFLPTSTPSSTIGGLTDIVNTPEFLACKARSHVYDRGTSVCRQATIAVSYACTLQGVTDAFMKFHVSVTTQLQAFSQAGYQIDQCGEISGEPIVFFYKEVDSASEQQLLIKKLCKQGSPACDG